PNTEYCEKATARKGELRDKVVKEQGPSAVNPNYTPPTTPSLWQRVFGGGNNSDQKTNPSNGGDSKRASAPAAGHPSECLMLRPRACGCLILLVGMISCALAGCSSDGHFTFLGYTTRPNYDCDIRTVYVPIFQNVTFRRGLEFDLTRAVIREIESKTPFKVVSCADGADTELTEKIITRNKAIVNVTQINEIREAETTLGV